MYGTYMYIVEGQKKERNTNMTTHAVMITIVGYVNIYIYDH